MDDPPEGTSTRPARDGRVDHAAGSYPANGSVVDSSADEDRSALADEHTADLSATGGAARPVRRGLGVAGLVVALVVLVLVSFGLGRYLLSPWTVVQILVGQFGGGSGVPGTEQAVVLQVRLPRILAALLVGAALAASGAAYQSMFRNPLVSPEILGVSAAAGFGASLSLLFGWSPAVLQVLAFGGGVLAALLSLTIGRVIGRGSSIVLVLGGIVVGAMFQALISVTQYVANPEDTLPAITFWLLGGLGRLSAPQLLLPALVVAACLVVLWSLRWPLTVLSAVGEDTSTLGIDPRLTRTLVIAAATLMTATVVSVAGIIGWVGLVVPHLARLITGPSFARVLPVSVLLGAGYLLAVDDVARSATGQDLPLGILTALIGAPFFVALLAKAGRQWR